jgi:acyl carrier protein
MANTLPLWLRSCLTRSTAGRGEDYAMTTLQHTETSIRRVLRDHGRLGVDADQLSPDADLYQSGMTSHASVNVMLALEGEFDVEFPDHMLNRNVFRTIRSIEHALGELVPA